MRTELSKTKHFKLNCGRVCAAALLNSFCHRKDFNYSYFVNPASISVPIGSSQKFISRPLNFADTILIVGNKIQGGRFLNGVNLFKWLKQ